MPQDKIDRIFYDLVEFGILRTSKNSPLLFPQEGAKEIREKISHARQALYAEIEKALPLSYAGCEKCVDKTKQALKLLMIGKD